MATETEVEERLGPDHPKLKVFQKAVEEVLKKRLQEADEEYDFLMKENADKKQSRAEQTTQLHETQRLLKLEQRKLKAVTAETQAIANQRFQLENANRKYEQKIKELKVAHKRAQATHDVLREKYNKAVAAQIFLTARRVNMAGTVNACQTEASKAEEDFRKLQEQKKAQDLYLDKLSKDMEDLEQKALEYQSQADAMHLQTDEVMNLVRKSEEETEKVRLEKMSIMQKWTTAVINLSKRDEALENFRNALKKQELALKNVKAEIEGTKEEIVNYQEKHEHLTTLSLKAERLCLNRRNQIKRVDKQVEEAKLELNKVHEAHLKTLETLKMTENQAKDVEKELSDARVLVTKLTNIKRDITEENLQLDRDQAVADKSSQYAMKKIKELRDKTKALEDNLIESQNLLSTTMEEIMVKVAIVDHQDEEIHRYDEDIDQLKKLLEQIESGLLKAQATIDKKQSQIDIKVKERNALVLAKNGAALSPLEAEIERTKNDIEATQEFCAAAKKTWLKYQNEFIDLVEQRTAANGSLTDLQRKYLIMQEKKMKMSSDIEALKQSLFDLKKRIETKNGIITRINRQFSEEKSHYNSSVESIEAKRALEVNALSNLVTQVEAIKVEVETFAKNVETEKIIAAQAAEELVRWEDEVKNCTETRGFVKEEKDNVEALKVELHKRQVRAEYLAKTTKDLMESLANCVSRRETLVNRAVASSTHRASQRPQTTRVLIHRKVDDLRNKLKKLAREEKEIVALINEYEDRENQVAAELDAKQKLIQNLQDKSEELNQHIEKCLNMREAKMIEILRLQTKARWYRSVKAKKYKMSVENDEACLNEIVQLRDQNQEMRKLLGGLLHEYPFYKRHILKAVLTIGSE